MHNTVQCNQKTEARRPDIVFIDKKEKEVVMIDVAIPGDDGEKEVREIPTIGRRNCKSLVHANLVIIVLVVIGALAAVSVIFKECIHEANHHECEGGSRKKKHHWGQLRY